RGNHESASINKMYGFYDECKRRYSTKLWRTFTDCFNCLPIAAIVDDKIFCAHGGLSPELFDMEQINRVSRPTDVPDTGERRGGGGRCSTGRVEGGGGGGGWRVLIVVHVVVVRPLPSHRYEAESPPQLRLIFEIWYGLATARLLCDLLWSDPDRDIIGWGENDRGVSFTFGEDIVRDFLASHDLDLICRAHQVTMR
ncbi:unnamed protein product, partial [Ectocarpus sp. 12 AP-2014]